MRFKFAFLVLLSCAALALPGPAFAACDRLGVGTAVYAVFGSGSNSFVKEGTVEAAGSPRSKVDWAGGYTSRLPDWVDNCALYTDRRDAALRRSEADKGHLSFTDAAHGALVIGALAYAVYTYGPDVSAQITHTLGRAERAAKTQPASDGDSPGVLIEVRVPPSRDELLQARAAFVAECHEGLESACHEAALIYGEDTWHMTNYPGVGSLPLAIRYSGMACTKSNPHGCLYHGRVLVQAGEKTRAEAPLSQACELGYQCADIAYLLDELGRPAEALGAADRGCREVKDSIACFFLATKAEERGDQAAAQRYHKQSCSYGMSPSCGLLE